MYVHANYCIMMMWIVRGRGGRDRGKREGGGSARALRRKERGRR